jgi:hypothetical protein
MTWQEHLLIVVVFIGVLMMFAIPIYILFFGGVENFAERPLQRCFRGIQLKNSPSSGDVTFVYHTYRGFLLWFIQDEHCVCASADDAEKLLKRLLRFNLTWGMLSYGMLFVPLIAYGNYAAQMRSLRQQQVGAIAPPKLQAPRRNRGL